MGIFNRKDQSQKKRQNRKPNREQQDENPALNDQVQSLLVMGIHLQNGR